MSQDERRTIGLDRPIHLEWMDAAAGSLADGRSPKEARDFVWKLLDGAVAGKTAQSARGKTLTVISRVWLTVPAAARPLRDSALKVIAHASADDRLALHWALLSATYPFFLDVASQVGRLLSLNSDFSVGQLTRRVVEAWGDRSTRRPAIQRLVRSMSGWGVLAPGDRSGVYVSSKRRIAVGDGVAELLLEGFLTPVGRGMPLAQLLAHPAGFPFNVRVDTARLRRSSRLRVHRQGDQSDLVELVEDRHSTPPAPPKRPMGRKRPSRATKQLRLIDQ